jgi:hypothetical protein
MENIISFSSPIKDPFIYPKDIKLPVELDNLLKDGFVVKSFKQDIICGKAVKRKKWGKKMLKRKNISSS